MRKQNDYVTARLGGWTLMALLTLSFQFCVYGSTRTVTTTVDSGLGSLRAAITSAVAGDAIIFSNTTAGGATNFFDGSQHVIMLASALPQLAVNLSITGPGPTGLALDGASTYQGFNIASSVTVSISGMKITHCSGSGGAGIGNSGTLTVNSCDISNNIGTSNGGGILNLSSGTLTVLNSFFTGNQTGTLDGGGIFNFNGTSTVINCTFTGNQASQGGGYKDFGSGSSVLSNCTFVGNTATYGGFPGGGAIFALGSLTVNNTIMYNDSGNEFVTTGGTVAGDYNLSGDGTAPGSNSKLNTNAQVNALANNGGPTNTISLKPNSPAIGGGLNTLVPGGTNFDQRGTGFPRIQGTRVDIGAFEFVTTESLVVTTVVDEDNGTSDNTVGAGTSLREALKYAATLGGARTITFNPVLTGQITLNGSEIPFATAGANVTIQGPGASTLAISGNNASRIFNVSAGTLTLNDIALLNANAGAASGGAILNSATVSLNRVIIQNNTVNGGTQFHGAGVYTSGSLTAVDSVFASNSGAYFGGGLYAGAGTVNLTGCLIVGNTASFTAGFSLISTTSTIKNCTFTNNSSSQCALGIYGGGANLTVINSTIANNPSGGFQNQGGTNSFQNTIIAGNTNFDVTGIAITSNGNNLFGTSVSGAVGSDLRNVNPNLGPLQNNGGFLPTMALLPGSPAIDAGNNAGATGLTNDQRGAGFARVSGTSVDIGAFELQKPLSFTLVSGSPQTTPVATVFGAPLTVQIKDSNGFGVSGTPITFSAPASGASAAFPNMSNSITVPADGAGMVPLPVSANTVAGSYSVSVSYPGLATPLTFSLTNTAGAPSNIVATGGNPQSATVFTTFGSTLQATVTDAFGNPISGVSVTFAVPVGGPSASITGPSTVTTNSSGVAAISSVKANTIAGSYTVTANYAGGQSPAIFTLTNTAAAPANIAVSAGTPQTANVNTTFSTPLQAVVTDTYGNVVSGASVIFTAPASGPSATFAGSNSVLTDALGIATAPALTANTQAGSYSVSAGIAGLGSPLSFALTNTAGAPANLTLVAGDAQITAINTAFGTALKVLVKDAFGNPCGNATVTFTAPVTGPSGSFATSSTVVADSFGVATAPVFTANAITGPFTVTAGPGRIAPISFNLANGTTPAFTSLDNVRFAIGVGGSFTVQASAIPKPVLTAGALPTGVTFTDNNDGTATLKFSASATPVIGTYTIPLTAANGLAPNGVQQFKLTLAANPPVITGLTTNDNPTLFSMPTTYLLLASATYAPTLSYTFDFGDGSALFKGTFTQGTSISFAHTYTVSGDYMVTATVSDSVNTATMTVAQSVLAPPSQTTGIPNISNGTDTVSNPTDNLTVAVSNSNGGVIQLAIDVSSLTRSSVDLTTIFGDISGRSSKVGGSFPVHQYVQHGIFVATVTATDSATGAVIGKGRKTLTISTKETGEAPPSSTHSGTQAKASNTNGASPVPERTLDRSGRDTPNPTPDIATKSIKGKFDFSGSTSDTVAYSGTVTLPRGLDLRKDFEFWISIGNIVVKSTITKGGKGTNFSVPGIIKTLKVVPKSKIDFVTIGGEQATVTVFYSAKGTVNAGFDTEGINNRSTDTANGTPAPRKIQVSMLVDGAPFETLTPVDFLNQKGSLLGTISGRSAK